ncbi:mitochondrial carrier [Nadsonia fulvescens var. elongata DSM 6958]|uniref:Mitochondrial carrier n=1 Tax=Nadsonia fulvescens var. elongata DSM 6958 TaxID=857566 RepID=A0A1E3PH31_9ASCO|nr:mitochondrial carrier [Nadsonia fulvescens var. elongata DSM 6958]
MSETKPRADPWKSFVAGGVAGGIEGLITYPFEFTKTRLQLADASSKMSRNPLVLMANIVKTQGVASLYTGCPAFIVGNTFKASVRFLGFDSIKKLLVDDEGKLSGFRGMLAGLGAGIMESVVAVTPFETIKTSMIDDKRRSTPRYQGLFSGTARLVRDKGFAGIYKGLMPVTMRQAANQSVRLGSYNAIKGFIQARQSDPSKPLGSVSTFAVGSLAGIITVYVTMPLDTVKTRMQSLDSKKYSSTWNCFAKIAKDEGYAAFWKGATPRLGRLVLSGGIVFTVYEKIMLIL